MGEFSLSVCCVVLGRLCRRLIPWGCEGDYSGERCWKFSADMSTVREMMREDKADMEKMCIFVDGSIIYLFSC